MKKFRVFLNEWTTYYADVQAETQEEAEDKALELYEQDCVSNMQFKDGGTDIDYSQELKGE